MRNIAPPIPTRLRVECVYCKYVEDKASLPIDLKLAGWMKVAATRNVYSNGVLVRERTHIGWCPKCAKEFHVEE